MSRLILAALAGTLVAAPVRDHTAATADARRALDDATIVAIFDAANTFDIETATLGARKATTREIRDYASMLIKAHTDARQQGRDLAKKLHVTPTPPAVNPLAAAHDSAMKRLRALSGKAFDRAFLDNEVAYHKTVISAVQQTLLPAITNADLRALVTRLAPVFVQHEGAAEALLAKLQ